MIEYILELEMSETTDVFENVLKISTMRRDWVNPDMKLIVDKICLKIENLKADGQMSVRYTDISMMRETLSIHNKRNEGSLLCCVAIGHDERG